MNECLHFKYGKHHVHSLALFMKKIQLHRIVVSFQSNEIPSWFFKIFSNLYQLSGLKGGGGIGSPKIKKTFPKASYLQRVTVASSPWNKVLLSLHPISNNSKSKFYLHRLYILKWLLLHKFKHLSLHGDE